MDNARQLAPVNLLPSLAIAPEQKDSHHRRSIVRLAASMRASQTETRAQSAYEDLQKALPVIELHHGEALWVLSRLGFQGGTSKSTFYEYIKSLRKLGTPFDHGTIGYKHRGLANYSYCHLMELALALTLRVYHAVPDSVLVGIIRYRAELYRYYRRAYAERSTGIGAPIVVKAKRHASISMRGVFLDLQINFSGGKLVKFGPPRLLAPLKALSVFAKRHVAARALLPINLSLLSERLVWTALHAPIIRRGPRMTIKTRRSAKGDRPDRRRAGTFPVRGG
jgi:hypothetical protein